MTREEAIKGLDGFKATAMWNGSIRLYTALSMAISALREQEERSKGCEHCHPPFRNIFATVMDLEDDAVITFVECDGQSLRMYDDNPYNPQVAKAHIKFCPMCRRRLENT